MPSSALPVRPSHAPRAGAALLLLGAAMLGCRDPAVPSAAPAGAPADAPPRRALIAAPPGASVSVTVQVPTAMRSAPFDVARSLTVPAGFSASVYARVPGARFMAVAPNGDLLVSNPGAGTVSMVRARAGGNPTVTPWATGLYLPHDIVFHAIGGQTYVYVAEGDKIARYAYTTGDSVGRGRELLISGLPSARSPELGGSYGHELKNIALDPAHNLYVSVASISNADPADVTATPPRAAVYQYSATGGAGRVFARGLRNAEGLAFVPGTSTLWVAVNNRDNIAYPFHNDFTGDGTDDYGKVLPTYVDNHPPEEFTRVVDGGNYGWPYCNPNPDTSNGMDEMPFDRDVQTNADGTRLDCATATRVSKGIQAHSAPLGLTFLQGTAAPAAYREGAAIAYHGSWNRTQRTGYKVAYFPWDAASGRPGGEIDLVTGWTTGDVWGRPVDVAVAPDGAILVSDDKSGTIYRFTYAEAPAPTQRVTSFTLINADTDQPIAGFDPIANRATLNLATLPTRNLNVRANTSPAVVGSVRFGYDANASARVESGAPYALAGDQNNGTDFLPWTPTIGAHTLTATPYTGADGTGAAGTALTITFAVTDKRKGPK